MGRQVAMRVVQIVPLLLGVSIAVFLMLHLAPGDPAAIVAGIDASPEDVAMVRERMGLDRPLPVQYVMWLNRALHGDLGESYMSQKPVLGLVLSKLPATIQLAIGGIIVTLIISIPLGVMAATRLGSIFDYATSIVNSLTLAIPGFWWGILLILVFAVKLGWFPASGQVSFTSNPWGALRGLVLPSTALGLSVSGVVTRQVRSAVLEVMSQDYIRTARAKGLRERTVISRHVAKNAAIPVVTILALYLGRLLGGAVVIEVIFAWPGIGRLVLNGVLMRDYTIVQGALLITSMIIVLINLLTDLVYAFLDPRIRY